MKLSIVIPVFNEESTITEVLEKLSSIAFPFETEIVIVDDGSTDRTAEVARAGGAEVVSFPENRGLPAGIAAGYAYALAHEYHFCGRVDADGQHPVHELRRLLDRVRAGGCDVAVGSRFASGDGYADRRYEATTARRFGHFVLRRLMHWRLERPMMDATSGLYAVNDRAIPLLAEPYEAGAPEVEGLIRLTEAGLHVEEVPVEMRERASGESKLQGKKAVMLVLTVGATVLLGRRVWRGRG